MITFLHEVSEALVRLGVRCMWVLFFSETALKCGLKFPLIAVSAYCIATRTVWQPELWEKTVSHTNIVSLLLQLLFKNLESIFSKILNIHILVYSAERKKVHACIFI